MKRFIACVVAVIMLFTVTMPKIEARADGLTLGMVGAAAYVIARDSGLVFTFANGGTDGKAAAGFIENRVNSYLGGRTLAEVFGNEVIRLTVGKMVIPSVLYNNIRTFLNNLISTEEITNTAAPVGNGVFDGYPVYGSDVQNNTTDYIDLLTNPFLPEPSESGFCVTLTQGSSSYRVSQWYNGEQVGTTSVFFSSWPYGWCLTANTSGQLFVSSVYIKTNNNQATCFTSGINSELYGAIYATITAQVDDYQDGTVDVGYQWEGSLNGIGADTNVEQLIGSIYEDAGQNDLVIDDSDVVATPADAPQETTPPGTITDVVGGLNTISGQLEGIDNTMTGVQEGVGEAVGQLEGINEGVGSISEALEVPTASEAPTFKFDLTTLFPFCIPFDIYRFVTMFSASPVAPHVQIPFNIPAVGLQYTFDLDFTSFDSVASVLRSVELIAFCVGLAILTSKVIRW